MISNIAFAGENIALAGEPQQLRVCADPNDLPFSNRTRQGFENKIVELLAKDLGAEVRYVWWAQRSGYVRSTLNQSKCDVWPGIAAGVDSAATSAPYYRSTYVFVTRRRAHLAHLSLDDPRLRSGSIGVQLVGNDAMNTPPAHAIAARGIVEHVRGYTVFGDYSRPNPSAQIIDAVAHGEIDVALAWGPLAGYFANREPVPLRIDPVTPAEDPRWPMSYDIAMGVRKGNEALLGNINASLKREQRAIRAILRSYHVPIEP
jgi:mxaJ protein